MFLDLRFAFRALCKTPLFTAAAILILALGIGANTSVFSVVEAVLLRPLPYSRPQEIVNLHSPDSNQFGLFNVAEFCAYRDQTKTLTGLSAVAAYNTTLVDRGEAQLVQGLRLSGGTFDLLGVRPVAGRLLTADDDRPGAPKIAVLGYQLWQREFGGQSDVIGRSISLGGQPRTIVGILPSNFLLPLNGNHDDVCVPFQVEAEPTRYQMSALHFLRVFGRLAPGATRAQVTAESNTILAGLRRNYPTDFPGSNNYRLTSLADEIVGDSRPVLLTLLGIVGSLLLLASANLSGLLLVRGLGRQRELAIRSALGCSKAQLMRLLLAESFLLAVAGGVAGFCVAQWSLDVLLALVPAGVPRAHDVAFNGTVLAFTAAVSLVAGLAPGLAPLWLCSRMDLRDAVNTGGRGYTGGAGQIRLRHLLASVQIALALALLACTGLFLRSFWAIDTQRPGSDPAHILTARLSLPEIGYRDRDALIRFYEGLHSRLAAIPGVKEVGTTSLLPLATGLATTEFRRPGHAVESGANLPSANYRLVSPGYFEAMGMPLRDGRLFTEADDAQHPIAAIVSTALAKAFFPNQPAVGQRLEVNDSASGYRTVQIVGVAADVKQQKMEDAPSYDIYVPTRQMDAVAVPWIRLRTFWVLRSMGSPQLLEAALRREVRAVDPGVPVASVATMEQVADSALGVRRFTLIIIGFLAGVALLLTIAGVYATIAYGVAQRTREMGVRLALGATAGEIFRLVVGQGIRLLSVGAILGLAAAVGLSQVIASQLYGVSPSDPIALGGSVLLLFIIALIASSLPALRAARVDPMIAMRTD
jgi:putative ABC transport system permease protein